MTGETICLRSVWTVHCLKKNNLNVFHVSEGPPFSIFNSDISVISLRCPGDLKAGEREREKKKQSAAKTRKRNESN